MAIYKVRDPSGQMREIKGPDGASDEQVIAEAKRLFAEPANPLAKEGAGYRLAAGFARPIVETMRGVQQLAGMELSDAEETQLAQLRDPALGTAGTVGRVGGELAMFAAPGGAVTKGAARLPRALKMMAEIGTVAGMEALKSPTEDRSRAQAAAQGAIGAGAGAVVGAAAQPVLRRAVQGIKHRAPGADQMLKDGVPLTPGMVAPEGSAWRSIEQRLQSLPVVGGQVAKAQRTAQEAWNTQTLGHVMPKTTHGADAFKAIKDGKLTGVDALGATSKAWAKSYDEIWDAASVADEPALRQSLKSLRERGMQDLPKQSADRFAKNVQAYEQLIDEPTGLMEFDRQLRKLREAATKRGNNLEADFYSHARNTLRNNVVGPDGKVIAEPLRNLDGDYRKFMVVQQAGTGTRALQNGGVFTPAELLSSVRSNSTGRQLARNEGPLQQEASQAVEVINGLVPSGKVLGETLTAPAVGLGLLLNPVGTAGGYIGARTLASEPTRKLLTGKYDTDTARLLIEALRRRAAYTGGAVEE